MRRLSLLAAAAAALAASAPAAARPAPQAPMHLPGAATAAAAGTTWLVGGRPGRATAALARRAGGRSVGPGAFAVPVAQARGLAHALSARRLLRFAERNRVSHFAAVAEDPLTADNPWREAVFDPMLDPPAVTDTSPLLALIDEKADITHPEFTGDPFVSSLPGGGGVVAAHGTQTLGTAVSPVNGIGITGAYPGARAVNVPLPKRILCSDSAKGIRRATGAGAAVINMSYGSSSFCFTEFLALENAVKHGVILVAAGGNEGSQGNPFEFPASLPHVLTIGALAPGDRIPSFSNSNAALDLVAPGVSITVPTPVKFDNDDAPDGYETVDGTSFSAPIVAAAALWLRAARPDLTPDQAAQVLRLSSTDIFRKGYDSVTGYGKLNMAQALVKDPPIADPAEPNETVSLVTNADPVWSGGAPATFQALADYFEDPGDVYRIRLKGHQHVVITLQPDFGNPDLYVYDGATKKLGVRSHVVARSTKNAKKTDRVRIRNGGGDAARAYVYVVANRRPTLDTRYTLDIRTSR